MPTIGLVIPCYKPHIGLLKRVFDSIEKQTRHPDMVIVSCSSSEPSDIPYKQEDFSFPFKIYTHREKKNISENKNFGTHLINTDIVMNDTFWIGVWPGLTIPMLDFMIDMLHKVLRRSKLKL